MIRIQGDLLDFVGRSATVQRAVDQLGQAEQEDRGAVFTRPEVVEFILDLVGYTPDRPLATMPLLDPAVGTGAFFCAALQRLLRSLSR